MNGLIELVFAGFPPGYCYPGDPSDLFTDAFNYTSVEFTVTGNVYYNWSETVPSVENRVYPWLRKYGLGVWDWSATEGGWIKAHSVPASSDFRALWVGTTTDLQTFDGGNVNAVADSEGPMWEVDTDFAGRIPMGPGTVGSETLDVDENYGAATVTLTDAQLEHTHAFGNYAGGNDDARFLIGSSDSFSSTNSMMVHGDSGNPEESNITAGNLITAPATAAAGIDPVVIVPPVRGCYLIKRTARIYYKVLTL